MVCPSTKGRPIWLEDSEYAKTSSRRGYQQGQTMQCLWAQGPRAKLLDKQRSPSSTRGCAPVGSLATYWPGVRDGPE